MKSGDRPVFADFLAEAGGSCEGRVQKTGGSSPEAIPIRKEDALSLSVQGRKAFIPGRDKKGGESSEREEPIRSTDWQGNKVRLSTSGCELSRDVEEKVAWETKLERKKDK